MGNPAISVIIPSYNPTRYIRQCVQSVLKQTMKDFEVIIIDDGSGNQRELAFFDKLANQDSRLHIVRNKHQGVSLTRKDGFLLSKGAYVCYLDADDYMPSDALERLYKIAIEKGADIIVGNDVRVADSYGLIRIKKYNSDYAAAGRLIQREDILQVCYGPLVNGIADPVKGLVTQRLFRSSCVKEALKNNADHLFPPTSVELEDLYFNLTIMPYVNSMYLINDTVYFYRYGGTSTTLFYHTGYKSGYFDYRFEMFEKWNFHEGFPRTFAAFAAYLYCHLKIIILSGKFSQEEMIEFVRNEIIDQKVVGWAKQNMDQIDSLPSYYKIVATGTAEDIFGYYFNALHTKRFKWHLKLKQLALSSSKILDALYFAFH